MVDQRLSPPTDRTGRVGRVDLAFDRRELASIGGASSRRSGASSRSIEREIDANSRSIDANSRSIDATGAVGAIGQRSRIALEPLLEANGHRALLRRPGPENRRSAL